MSRVILKKVKKSFGDFVALHELDLDIQEGEFLTLLGPSGCGKSTLLRCLNRMNDLVEDAQWETAFQTYNSKVSINCIFLSITDNYQVYKY
jgi:ABC-type phosphate transport system ATPase subunit